LTAATGVTHERISFPSSSTEQAPHCARPHPNLGPWRCSSLCRTYRRGVSRLAVTLCTRPLTLIFNLLAMPPPFSEYRNECLDTQGPGGVSQPATSHGRLAPPGDASNSHAKAIGEPERIAAASPPA